MIALLIGLCTVVGAITLAVFVLLALFYVLTRNSNPFQ
jgi:uncharacterized membrane protein YphA (DoxX/SURF4 family)